MEYCLAIESTAHTFGAAVVGKKKGNRSSWHILSNCKKAFVTTSGGMIPAQVAQHHVDCCDSVIRQALKESDKKISDITFIAYSRSPGIGHMLRVGLACAKSLSLIYNLPLVGVNHSISHLEIGRALTKAKDPILVYASGANTQIIAYNAHKYRIFGETIDIGIGNFLDSFARSVGLGFPGGPKIAELATKSTNYIPLPYTVKGMDISFGGILTNVKTKFDSKKYALEDLCFSIQETVFAMLTEITERALSHCQKKEVLLGGGVACNVRLQSMMKTMCEARGAQLFLVENQYNVDNAAMIGIAGFLTFETDGPIQAEKATINPYERVEQVDITWRK